MDAKIIDDVTSRVRPGLGADLDDSIAEILANDVLRPLALHAWRGGIETEFFNRVAFLWVRVAQECDAACDVPSFLDFAAAGQVPPPQQLASNVLAYLTQCGSCGDGVAGASDSELATWLRDIYLYCSQSETRFGRQSAAELGSHAAFVWRRYVGELDLQFRQALEDSLASVQQDGDLEDLERDLRAVLAP